MRRILRCLQERPPIWPANQHLFESCAAHLMSPMIRQLSCKGPVFTVRGNGS